MHLRELLVGVVLLIVAFPALADDDKKEAKKDKEKPAVIAHIKLSGDLSEAANEDNPFGGGAENLKAKLDRIKNQRSTKFIYVNVFT